MEELIEDIKMLDLDNTKPKYKPLLILDLNNFLVDRVYNKLNKQALIDSKEKEVLEKGAERVGNFIVYKRPSIDYFLKIAFHNFEVAVWSSVSKWNIDLLVDHIFEDRKKLFFIYDQRKCTGVEHPNEKYKGVKLLYKKNLATVWKEFKQYNKTNTLIIDDSELKMKDNPNNCWIPVEEWKHTDQERTFDLSHGVLLNLAQYIMVPK